MKSRSYSIHKYVVVKNTTTGEYEINQLQRDSNGKFMLIYENMFGGFRNEIQCRKVCKHFNDRGKRDLYHPF